MNPHFGKFAVWCVRVVDGKIIQYEFKSRNETVYAEKFECLLVSKDPEQYMLATVPFLFSDRQSATKAFAKFKNGDVLEITTPAFDPKARPEFNGCPLKPVLLLTKPTTVKHIPCTHNHILEYPARGLQVSLHITKLLNHLKDLGSAKSTKTFDFGGKIFGISGKKSN